MNKDELLKIQSEIVKVNIWLDKFWSNAQGWAPQSTIALISKSRLDNQVSLSHTLEIWIEKQGSISNNGRLILAWANLGALIEGTLKLYLCVYSEDYRKDSYACKNKKDKVIDPDSLALEKLRVFMNKRGLWTEEWNKYVLNVQQKRNAIHAFQDRNIGTFEGFYSCLPPYLKMLDYFNLGLPYPEEVNPEIISTELAPMMDEMRVRFEKKIDYSHLF